MKIFIKRYDIGKIIRKLIWFFTVLAINLKRSLSDPKNTGIPSFAISFNDP